MAKSLKQSSINGVIWSSIEKVSVQFIHFLLNIILARLLMPEDYGVIAIINVFLVFSQLFIDGGFTTALIQKKNRTDRDFSTVYIFNIVISCLIYLILFLSADFIGGFFNYDKLPLYIRTLSLILVISSFSAISKTKLTINIDFKAISKVTIISLIISGIVGVICAYSGLGVWSLIIQYVINTTITTILFRFWDKTKTPLCFDWDSFKTLFGFSHKLVLSSCLDRIYASLYPVFISKFFTPTKLGYYTRADQFAGLPSSTITDILMRVTFPILSKINDENQLIRVYRKYISLSSFLLFPIVFLVVTISEPIIILLLTAKWTFSIHLMQILLISYMFDNICSINRNLLYVKGRSDIALKLEVMKKTLAFTILIISLFFKSIEAICYGRVLYDFLSVFLNCAYTYKLVGLKFMTQIKDFLPSFICSVIATVSTMIIISFYNDMWMKLMIGTISFSMIYMAMSVAFNYTMVKESRLIIKQYIPFKK